MGINANENSMVNPLAFIVLQRFTVFDKKLKLKNMKKITSLFLIIFAFASTQAQNYQISFAGNGASTVVDSVKVENLTQCADTTLSGSDILQCNTGDTLKLTGKSGNYRTVVMLVPNQNQTVTFTFVDCTDADGNHYAVVQIGTQLWMAENLKATKYRDGTSIPNLSDSALWHNATTGGYCDYHNIASEGAQYGHLYNWYAADTTLNIAPVGWHVSTDAEWTALINFLGGLSTAGQKIKENCNTRWAYLDSTWGKNTCGFTALCTNFRNGKGANIDWSMAPNNDHDSFIWTSTNFSSTTAYVNALRYCYRDVWRCNCVSKAMGACIRCVKDSVATSIDNMNYNELKIYPNPSTEKVHIDCAENQIMKMQVYNMIGECVMQKELNNIKNEIDISSLSKGVYVIKLIGANWFIQSKLTKE